MSGALVISPHPDDESIGCGGALRRHVLDGERVCVLFLTSGEKGGHGRSLAETARLREAEAAEAARILGISQIEFWHAPDGAVRATRPLVERLRQVIADGDPDVVYVPHEREMHPDHRAAARLVRQALGGRGQGRPRVLMYEVWTPLQWMDHVVDISDVVEVKRAAILAYKTQCDAMRFDQAALALARYRGEMHSWPGGDYAEIFKEMRF